MKKHRLDGIIVSLIFNIVNSFPFLQNILFIHQHHMHSFISYYNVMMMMCFMMNIFIIMQFISFRFLLFSLFENFSKIFLTFLKKEKSKNCDKKCFKKQKIIYVIYHIFILKCVIEKGFSNSNQKNVCRRKQKDVL